MKACVEYTYIDGCKDEGDQAAWSVSWYFEQEKSILTMMLHTNNTMAIILYQYLMVQTIWVVVMTIFFPSKIVGHLIFYCITLCEGSCCFI